MFSSIKAKLSGIKTYLVATGLICGAVVAWQQDQISVWEAGKTICGAIGLMTMRAAVAKIPDATAANVAPPATPLAPPATIVTIPIPPTVNVTNNPHNIGDDLTRTGN